MSLKQKLAIKLLQKQLSALYRKFRAENNEDDADLILYASVEHAFRQKGMDDIKGITPFDFVKPLLSDGDWGRMGRLLSKRKETAVRLFFDGKLDTKNAAIVAGLPEKEFLEECGK